MVTPEWDAVAEGPAEREFIRFVHRYTHRIRATVVGLCALLSVPAMPVDRMGTAALIGGFVLGWSILYYWLDTSATGSRRVLAADLVVLTGICLTQGLTVPGTQELHGNTWVLVAVSIVAVAYQLVYPAKLAFGLALYLAVVDLAGAVLDRPDGWTYALPNAGWLLVQAALSQGLYRLVRNRSREADAASAAMARARRRHEVAQAQRAAEREYLATLHDTACATLLMAAVRGQSIDPGVLRVQAAKDLRRLAAERVLSGETDVAAELRAEIDDHALCVTVHFDGPLGEAWHPAVVALRGSVGEALRNVARHAGVHRATVSARRRGEMVTVLVSDTGVGFDPSRVPAHCQGLARSVIERMASVGGRATVESEPGKGTDVRLEWPRV